MGDSDEIAVLARDEALEVAELLRRKEATEPALKERIAAGGSLAEASGALEFFEATGPK